MSKRTKLLLKEGKIRFLGNVLLTNFNFIFNEVHHPFSRKFSTTENRRKYLDEIALKLNINNPSDWGKISTRELRRAGGASLLNCYNNSIFETLQSIYEGILLIYINSFP